MTQEEELTEELAHLYVFEKTNEQFPKDIIIVVHDQLELIKNCITSIYTMTSNFTLYLWDNSSMEPTKKFLELISKVHDNVVLVRSEQNLGFIKPNNRLAEMGKSPHIILLNSDTKVMKNWDLAMIGWLAGHPNCKLVGYQGGALMENGQGAVCAGYGNRIDYVCGWCCCFTREDYNKFGLFDEVNLNFAYGEDSDFSLRFKELGYEIYALNMNLVWHLGNATSKEVVNEMDTSKTFQANHNYIRNRHSKYIAEKRILLPKPCTPEKVML
jgi:GT2 family glycosyltransferase